MKIVDIINKVLSEESQIKDKSKKSLKIFYKTDVLIQGFPERRSEEKAEEKADVTTESTNLLEDILKASALGELTVPITEADNIQTLEDLIDYLGDKTDKGKPIINDLIEEIVLSIADVGTKPLETLVNEGDKIFIDIDYGKEREDSIGIRVNKQAGSSAMSISMKKDNKIIPGEFDIEQFNKQLVYYRNLLFSK